ncbi:MAG: M56 family metallopeptidase [Sphingomicrobium sp.]
MTGWLLDTLLATSGLMLFVLIVREPVRRLFGSRVAYGLWLIPAARLFMPTLTRTIERTVPVHSSFQPLPVPLASDSLWMAQVASPGASAIDRVGGLSVVLMSLWLAVATLLFLSRILAFHRDRRAILDSAVALSRAGSIRIVRTPEVVSPVALGILRPIIAVPSDFERRYAPRERCLVLEHELAHHRSGDLVANLFAFVLLCLQWFNPLAWVAHAAFRFDQEAACDARVLDKGAAGDRADYGRAIAKAASGRALLFASALDRRNTLKRRLQSMLTTSNPARLVAGRLIILSVIAVALPLTAGRAVEYVDVPAPATPVAPMAQAAAVPAAAAVSGMQAAPVAAVRATAAVDPGRASFRSDTDDMTINEQFVTIDGTRKRWEDLTPAEKARVRAAVAKARTALANTHIDQAKIEHDLANVPDQARIEEMQRGLADSRARIAESIRRIDAEAADARAAGRQPDRLEAAIRDRLLSVKDVDFEAAARALAGIDRQKIAAQVAGAQESVERAKAELARIQAKIDSEQRH